MLKAIIKCNDLIIELSDQSKFNGFKSYVMDSYTVKGAKTN